MTESENPEAEAEDVEAAPEVRDPGDMDRLEDAREAEAAEDEGEPVE